MAQVLSTENQLSFPSRISARGIIAGVLAALAVDMLMLSFGAAIGLSAFHPTASAARGVAIWEVIWFFITVAGGGFFGAWVAAAASGAARSRDAMLHAFVTWAATTVVAGFFMAAFLSRTAALTAHLGNVAAQVAPNAGQAAQGAAAGVTPQQLQGSAGSIADVLGLSTWTLFIAMILSLGLSFLGGALAAGLERKQVEERAIGVREPGGTLPVA